MTKAKHHQKGFSLVEIIIVISIIGLLVLLISNLPAAITTNTNSRNRSIALDVAGKKMDSLRKQTYSNLTNGSSQFTDSALDDIPQAAATYSIEDCPQVVCTNSEDAKRIKIEVTWNESGETYSVNLETIITKGGIGQ